MVNPHICYSLGFTASLVVYLLGWSGIYPQISYSLLLFLAITILIHLVMSFISDRNSSKTNDDFVAMKLNPWIVTAFIYTLWSLDFLYEGGIPLFKILMNVSFDYKKFGFPMVHVLAVSFSSFFCVYLFQNFLNTKSKAILLLYAVNMAAAILVYSRAMLFFNLASSGFLYLLHTGIKHYWRFALGLPIILALLYLFGVAGTIRVSFESGSKYDNKLFLDNGRATRQFEESFVPKEFFWSYFYISSPLANLQTNINTYSVKPITTKRIFEYINNEMVFESLSKRINTAFGLEREKENVIKEPFNVSTVYSRSYSYLGWVGMLSTALVVIVLPFFYSRWTSSSPYRLTGIAIICSCFLFMSYDNTIRLMGFGFQLVYPPIFPLVEKMLVSIKTKFL